jgi:hypothetical protein
MSLEPLFLPIKINNVELQFNNGILGPTIHILTLVV